MTRAALSIALLVPLAGAAPAFAREAPEPTWSTRDRMVFAGLSLAFPGAGQFFQRRYMWSYVHGGGAVLLGAVGGIGWLAGSDPIFAVGALGLTAISAYSAFDAYLAEGPEP